MVFKQFYYFLKYFFSFMSIHIIEGFINEKHNYHKNFLKGDELE